MAGKFKFQAQDSFLEYFFLRFGDLKNTLSEKKPPLDLIPKLIFQASTSRAGKSINDEAVFIKKFPRYEDVFCLGVEERSRSLKMDNALPVNMTDTIGGNNLENFQRSEFEF